MGRAQRIAAAPELRIAPAAEAADRPVIAGMPASIAPELVRVFAANVLDPRTAPDHARVAHLFLAAFVRRFASTHARMRVQRSAGVSSR